MQMSCFVHYLRIGCHFCLSQLVGQLPYFLDPLDHRLPNAEPHTSLVVYGSSATTDLTFSF